MGLFKDSLHKECGVDPGRVINAMQEAGYTKFNSSCLSLAERSEKTGLCIVPEGRKLIAEKWPKFAEALPGKEVVEEKEKPAEKRVKKTRKNTYGRKLSQQFTFRTTEAFAKRMEKAMEALNYGTIQDFVLFSLNHMVTEIEKAASDAGTSKAANNRAVNESITWVKEEVNESV